MCQTQWPTLIEVTVPCNGCTICCKEDNIQLMPGEDHTQYDVDAHPKFPGAWFLNHKPNGDCIYLSETGCTIYERRPQLCREMDCRAIARVVPYTKVRKMVKRHILRESIWWKGKQLLKGGV